MALPYENATTGDKALGEIQKLLTRFGCQQFGHMVDNEMGEVRVMFSWNGRQIVIPASMRGYAAAWVKEHPYNYSRMRHTRTDHDKKASDIARIAVYSILRDWIKGQVTAVEIGLLTFEGAFLGQIMLPSGKTVLEHARDGGLLQLENK